MNDKQLVQHCLHEIAYKAGYADPSSLRQRDLEHLSDEIEKSTGILISISTIKRLLNGQFNRLPQVATLNAITNYLGYHNWQDFRSRKLETNGLKAAQVPQTITLSEAPKRRLPFKLIITATAVLIFIVTVSLKYFTRDISVSEKDVSFSIKKTTSNEVPNTVVFTYDVSKVQGDSFFIQQSWDRDRRVKIEKDKHTLTDIYYEPGYHNAKLIVNDKIVKIIDVSIPTKDWFFFSKPQLFRGLPTYIRPDAPAKNGMLALTSEDIIDSKIDPQRENFYAYTLFPENFEVPMDNFRLKTRIRFKELKNVKCPMILHEVCGQNNSLYFFTTLAGCTGIIETNVGEHQMSGKTTDLSGFGCDIWQWNEVELIVKNKEAKFFINEKEVFSKLYTKSPGLITGLVFSANGLCEIDNVSLKGLDGKVVYENQFGAPVNP